LARTRFQQGCADFATQLTQLLNSTVTDGATIRPVDLPGDRVRLRVGTSGCSRDGRFVRLRTTDGLYLWLGINVHLIADEDGHLTVEKSTWALLNGRDAEAALLHYDYERGKEGYPEAHLQVFGRHEALESVLEKAGRKRSRLHDLHLPVGGRRFRPTLEDLIEFLVDERLVEAKPHSKQTLERSRTRFHDIQLLATIRRRPGKAAEGLLDLGYKLEEPVPGRR
jgi:hypothetical protein